MIFGSLKSINLLSFCFLFVPNIACNKTVKYDKAKPASVATEVPKTNLQKQPADEPPATLPVRKTEPTVPISLKLLQTSPESWSKNCVSVSIVGSEGAEKNLGCNKDAQIGSEVSLDAKPDVCNVLRFKFSVYRNKGTCVSGQACAGKYDATPDWVRDSSDAQGLKYLKTRDAANMMPLDASIQIRANGDKSEDQMRGEYTAAQKAAQDFVKIAGNRWLRVFFEDQSDTNLAAWEADAGNWQKYGVDFNDFVFDLKSEGVKFKVEGSTIDSCK